MILIGSAAFAFGQDPSPPVRLKVKDARPLLGFAINAHHIGDLPLYLESVDAIADLGANSIVVVTPMWQKKASSSEVRTVPTKCPTDSQLLEILGRARERGLYTFLLPIVLIEEPGPDDWRGVIRPDDWDTWWASYRRTVERFTSIAVIAGVDMLSVGSELNSTEDQVDRWRELIAEVRRNFPGEITYSANWDRYQKVKFWSSVDVMSVSSYFELERDRPGAPEDDLVAAWPEIQEQLLGVANRVGRPLVLSEIGYPSLPWANAHPWNYVAKGSKASTTKCRRGATSAFFASVGSGAVADRSRARLPGFYCYHWDPYHQGQPQGHGLRRAGQAGQRDVIRDAPSPRSSVWPTSPTRRRRDPTEAMSRRPRTQPTTASGLNRYSRGSRFFPEMPTTGLTTGSITDADVDAARAYTVTFPRTHREWIPDEHQAHPHVRPASSSEHAGADRSPWPGWVNTYRDQGKESVLHRSPRP